MLDKTLAVGAFTPESTSIQHAALGTAMTSTGAAAGFFQGVLDEVRIWNVARSASQIPASKNSELTSGSGLIGRWGLNEGTGSTAANSVGGGVNGGPRRERPPGSGLRPARRRQQRPGRGGRQLHDAQEHDPQRGRPGRPGQ